MCICLYAKSLVKKKKKSKPHHSNVRLCPFLFLVTNLVQIKSTLATLKINLTTVQPLLFGVLV